MWSASEVFNDNTLLVHERKRTISFYKMHSIYVVLKLHAGVCFADYSDLQHQSLRLVNSFSLKKYTYFLFVQDLHGVELIWFFMFDKHNSPEWASAQSLEPIEVIQASCALWKDYQSKWRQKHCDLNASFFAYQFSVIASLIDPTGTTFCLREAQSKNTRWMEIL